MILRAICNLTAPFLSGLLIAWVLILLTLCLVLSFPSEGNEWSVSFLGSRLDTCNSVDPFECPFAPAILTFSLSHEYFLLLFLLLILFSKCLSPEYNFVFVVVNQSLFEIDEVLVILLFQPLTLPLYFRFQVGHHLLNFVP